MYQLKHYKKIGEPLKGGMGKVFHLHHYHWNMDIAMKQPQANLFQTEEEKDCFYRECERWISIGIHPNIVQCYFFCDVENVPSAFMEWMEKGSLSQQIESGNLYKGSDQENLLLILDISLQMAKGLAHSHKKGVLHLDVKPSNVLINKDGIVKISDFGISSLFNQQNTKVLYTPHYCAPEQLTNENINQRTDIYCWALCVMHMLVRDANWYNGVMAGVGYSRILKSHVVSFPETLKTLLGKCLQFENAERPAAFEDVIRELIDIRNSISGETYIQEEDFSGSSLDAYNNMGISYFNLGKQERASALWQRNCWKNPDHVSSYYNYHLYLHRYVGSCDSYFLESAKTNSVLNGRDEKYVLFLKSRWLYSIGAYASAAVQAFKAKQISTMQFGNSHDIYHENYEMMKAVYETKGPYVIKRYPLDKMLDLKAPVENDCKLLSYIKDDNLLYVSQCGNFKIIDLNVKKITNHETGFAKVTHAAVSRDGRYLALGNAGSQGVIRVIDLQIMKIVLEAEGSCLELKYLTFTEQQDTYPRLVAGTGFKIFDWKLRGTMQRFQINKQEYDHTYENLAKQFTIIHCLEEVDGNCIIVLGDRQCALFDGCTQEKLNQKLSDHLYEFKPLKMICVSGKSHVLILDEAGRYLIYDYKEQRLISQESFLFRGKEKIQQLTLCQNEKRMAVLCQGYLEIRNYPDYTALPKPLWEMNRPKSTAVLIKECKGVFKDKNGNK